jgi:hypothetical protein
MTDGQISYDLRRLRAHQIIERIPHSYNYQVTDDGLFTALFFALCLPIISSVQLRRRDRTR